MTIFVNFHIPRSSDSLDIAGMLRCKEIFILVYTLRHYDLMYIGPCIIVIVE